MDFIYDLLFVVVVYRQNPRSRFINTHSSCFHNTGSSRVGSDNAEVTSCSGGGPFRTCRDFNWILFLHTGCKGSGRLNGRFVRSLFPAVGLFHYGKVLRDWRRLHVLYKKGRRGDWGLL